MHLLEVYSLGSASKIKRPHVFTKFFPLGVDKYITLHPFSKPSKSYEFWQDVIDGLHAILAPRDISIVQIGAKEDKVFRNVYTTNGQTNIGQAAHIISNSLLHLGTDSFSAHIASGFGKKIVCLYSNNYANVVKPFWTKPEDCVLLEPDRTKQKPSFSLQENPKTINQIKPEDIIEAVAKLLEIEHKEPYTTEYVGAFYQNRLYESVPNQVLQVSQFGVDALIVRMDYLFDENILAEQLKLCPCCIVTDKPIPTSLLNSFRSHIKEVVYQVKDGYDLKFVQELGQLALNHFLTTELEGEKLSQAKLDFLDLPNLNLRPQTPKDVLERLQKFEGPLFYKSNKITLSAGKIYLSKAAWNANQEVANFEEVSPIINDANFWNEAENLRILSTRN
jgi:hypothetical protein